MPHASTALAATAILAIATAALAQPNVFPVETETVTTVSPLIVSPLAPVPSVGAGAPYFTPDEIQALRNQAVVLDRHTRWGLQDMRETMRGRAPKKEVFMMDFGLEALCDTLHYKTRRAMRAAEAADTATRAALAARQAEARGEGAPGAVVLTELARQQAVNAYVAARWEAQEAESRVADFNTIMQSRMGYYVIDMKGFIDERTAHRVQGGGAINAPEFADLAVTDIVARQTSVEDGVMTVTGKIHNPRGQAISIPPLTLTVLDRAGLRLTDWEIAADRRQSIPPGGELAFSYELKAPPAYAQGVLVNFAPARSRPALFANSCEVTYREE